MGRTVVALGGGLLSLLVLSACGLSARATHPRPTGSKHSTSHSVKASRRTRQPAANSAVPVASGKLQVLAFYATGVHVSLASLWKYPKAISVFSPFWYSVNRLGGIKSTVDASVLAAVKQHHIPIEPLVNDSTGVQAFLKTYPTRINAARNIADMVKAGGYQGVDIDFEPPNSALSAELTDFIMDLRDRLPRQDVLTLAVVPASGGAYNFKTLNPEITQYVVMSYDEHSQGTQPGPVAAMPWVENTLARFKQAVPAKKILLGIPLYGYSWPNDSTSAATIPFSAVSTAMRAHAVWNPQDLESTARYTANGVSYLAWWETLKGMEQKIALAKKNKLGGIALWRLGYQNDQVMKMLIAKIGAQP